MPLHQSPPDSARAISPWAARAVPGWWSASAEHCVLVGGVLPKVLSGGARESGEPHLPKPAGARARKLATVAFPKLKNWAPKLESVNQHGLSFDFKCVWTEPKTRKYSKLERLQDVGV